MTRLAAALAALAAAGSLGATCDGGGPSTPTITLTAPQGFGELVPGKTLAFAWTVSGALDAAATNVTLTSRESGAVTPIVADGVGGAGTTALTADGFTWGGLDAAGHALAIGYYDVAIDAGDGVAVPAGDSHIVVVEGVAFTTPAPGGQATVSAAAPLDLHFDTATTGTLSVELIADPNPNVSGDERAVKTLPVPGELRTIARVVTWDGTDATGAALPAGPYLVAAVVTDAVAGVTYRVDGGTATVQ